MSWLGDKWRARREAKREAAAEYHEKHLRALEGLVVDAVRAALPDAGAVVAKAHHDPGVDTHVACAILVLPGTDLGAAELAAVGAIRGLLPAPHIAVGVDVGYMPGVVAGGRA